MEPQNKEFPSFIGHETPAQSEAEVHESTEGLAAEQSLHPEETQNPAQGFSEQQETLMAPSPAESAMMSQAESPATTAVPDADHAAKHLSSDNKIESSGDAHDMLNDLLNGNYKP